MPTDNPLHVKKSSTYGVQPSLHKARLTVGVQWCRSYSICANKSAVIVMTVGASLLQSLLTTAADNTKTELVKYAHKCRAPYKDRHNMTYRWWSR